jgi:hypothetical protein
LNKRMQAALELGLLYGLITWILGTGVSNRIPGWGVWLILLDRIVIAFILYRLIGFEQPRWLKGAAVGLIMSIPLGLIAMRWPFFNSVSAWVGALGTGLIVGILISVEIEKHQKETSPVSDRQT